MAFGPEIPGGSDGRKTPLPFAVGEPRQRLIDGQRDGDSLSRRDIAEMLGIPEGTVKSKVYYTYRKLREKLEELKPDGM